jgi:hypothetical protein
MVTKTNRPSLKVDENDLLPERKAMSSDDEEDSRILAAADQLSARHSALRDGSLPTAALPSLPRPAPALVPTVMASWKVVVPDYLDRVLSRRAAERRVSKGFLVLEALAQAGYEIQPEDLIGDRRRKRQ